MMIEKTLVKNSLSAFIDSVLTGLSKSVRADNAYSKYDNCDILVAREKSNTINRYTNKSIVYQYNNKNNIICAVKALNGTVIRPNERFSFYDSIMDSRDKIYREGIDIEGDVEVIGHGRGLSQLTTQLVTTLIHSNLELVEHRSSILSRREYNINYPCGFVTVVDHIWDLVFENNTDDTYVIRAVVQGDELITELYTNSSEKEDIELDIQRKYNENKKVNKLTFVRNIYSADVIVSSDEVLSLEDGI